MVFKITIRKQGSISSGDAAAQFTFAVGRLKGTMKFSSGLTNYFSDADLEGGDNLTPIMLQMTNSVRYNCYLGTNTNIPLGMECLAYTTGDMRVLVFSSSAFTHNGKMGLDTGCRFAIYTKLDGSQTTKLAIPNTDSTGLQEGSLSGTEFTSMQVLKNVLGQFKTAYQTKATRLYTYGMCYLDTAFLVGVTYMYSGMNYAGWYPSAYAVSPANYSMLLGDNMRSTYIGLRAFWNWWSLLTGEFYFPVQWMETNGGKKVYLTLPITTPDDDMIFYDNPSYPFQANLKQMGEPRVCWDYQAGTTLLSLNKVPGNSTIFKNATVLTYSTNVDGNSRHYYRYEFNNLSGDEDYTIKAALNTNAYVGDMVDTNYGGIGVTNTYYTGSHDYLLRGLYLVGTPYEEAGIAQYIDENEGQPESFWNKYPSTPIQIMGVYTGIWNTDYKTEGDWTKRRDKWGTDNVYADLLLSNIAGYNQKSDYGYRKLINMLTTCNPNGTISSFASPNGGTIKIDSAEGARILWGITSEVDPETPTGGGGSIGGGGGGSHSGGSGSFDDSGDNIDLSMGSTFGASNVLTNWFLGHLGVAGDTQAQVNLNHIGDWLRTTLDPDSQAPWQGLGYKYSDKLNNMCSLKIIYGPEDPAISQKLPIKIHGQYLHDNSSEPYAQGYKVTSQFKSSHIVMNFNLEEYFGSFLDYEPYTKVQIYLPFAGIQTLKASDVIGKNISLHCVVDFLSGDIVYHVKVNTGTSNSILYSFAGNAAVDLPITSTDYSGKVMSTIQTILGAASVVAGIAGAGSTGGASLAATGGLVASGASQVINGGIGIATNDGITTVKGAVGGTIGAMSPLQCYLIVTRPKMVKAEKYGEINGYPCMQSYILGDLKGYVKVAECNWGIQGATEEEVDEIKNLMSTEGAII